jgi:hypothetical protein
MVIPNHADAPAPWVGVFCFRLLFRQQRAAPVTLGAPPVQKKGRGLVKKLPRSAVDRPLSALGNPTLGQCRGGEY